MNDMTEERYEVLVFHGPEEGEIEAYGVPDEVYSYKTKEAAAVAYDFMDNYYYKELIHYYNGVDGDCIMNDSNEYLEEVFTKALVLDNIMKWHKDMHMQGDGIHYNLERMEWMLENPTKGWGAYDLKCIGLE